MKKTMDVDKDNWNKVKATMDQGLLSGVGSYYLNEINQDIKHILFTLSRYKFASKLFAYSTDVRMLELGCSEGWGALLFQQNLDLDQYVGIDLDSDAINWNHNNLSKDLKFIEGNFFDDNTYREINTASFNAVVSMDVIEHINPEMEHEFCRVVTKYLTDDGVAVIGTPNIMMRQYASEASRAGHINLYDQKRLYQLLSDYFNNVFIFNMNDEVVNTGFGPMSCYIFAVCCHKKKGCSEVIK